MMEWAKIELNQQKLIVNEQWEYITKVQNEYSYNVDNFQSEINKLTNIIEQLSTKQL